MANARADKPRVFGCGKAGKPFERKTAQIDSDDLGDPHEKWVPRRLRSQIRRACEAVYRAIPIGRMLSRTHPPTQPKTSGRICGKSRTSRIEGESVKSMAKRSMPTPNPAVGGIPYSSARM